MRTGSMAAAPWRLLAGVTLVALGISTAIAGVAAANLGPFARPQARSSQRLVAAVASGSPLSAADLFKAPSEAQAPTVEVVTDPASPASSTEAPPAAGTSASRQKTVPTAGEPSEDPTAAPTATAGHSEPESEGWPTPEATDHSEPTPSASPEN